MAPAQLQAPAYAKDERVLCFHGELLYEAKILDSKSSDASDKKSPLVYRVHYKGWKKTWDDWVNSDRIRKLTEEHKQLAHELKKEFDAQRKPPPAKSTVPKKRAAGSDFSSNRASEERNSSVPLTGRGQKRGRDYELEKEEVFHSRPSIRIPCPDLLKAILVDDWENVTKNLQIVQLPSKKPVNTVLAEYYAEEGVKRRVGSPEAEILEEVIAGLKEYFEKCLGRILLYRFEREQYAEVRDMWEKAVGDEWEGKGPGDVYGAEHLTRLIVTMPELIAQTNMDHQAVSRLREELAKLTQWLAKHASTYFIAEYEAAGPEYADRARGL